MPRGRSFIRTIGGHINSALGSVATRLGVSKRVATVISAGVLAAGLGGTGYLVSGMSEAEFETFYVGDDEPCEDYIQQASDEIGQGEIQIPETTSGKYRTGYEGSWENTVESLSQWGGLKPVIDFYYNNNGHKDAQGFERVGDYYIVAIRWAAFNANTGDHITFYFDDGTSIEAIVGDEKAAVPKFNDPAHFDDPPELDPVDSQGGTLFSNGWGHILKPPDTDCQVLEFWGRPEGNVYDKLRASTGGNFQRVTSATNHGTVPGFNGGVLEGSASNSTKVKNHKAGEAIDECQANQPFDNSNIAAAAVSVAYSRRHTYGEGYPGTDLYESVCTEIFGSGDATASYGYRSCDRLVAMALRWSGADTNEGNAGPCGDVRNYYRTHSDMYEFVHTGVNVSSEADAKSLDLQPGDILINDNHTFIYVGAEAVEQGYNQVIKGHSSPSGGDCGEPESGSCFVHASNGNTLDPPQPQVGRAACIQTGGGSGYDVVRCIKPMNDDKYKDAGNMISLSLSLTNSKGTSCDCVKEEEEPSCGEDVANLAASLALSAVNDGKDYNQMLKDLGIYGSTPGYYYYGNEGRIHAGIDSDFAEPDSRIPKAEAWIEFQGSKCDPVGNTIPFHGNGHDKDGKHNLVGWQSFANCAPMPWDVWQYSYPELWDYRAEFFDLTNSLRRVGLDGSVHDPDPASQIPNGRLVKPHFTFIVCDKNKTFEEQCKPGDILCNGAQPHYMLYVGNEIAQKYFPGTTGNICEAGAGSDAYWGITEASGWQPSSDPNSNNYCWMIARPTVCNDENTDFGLYGMLPEDGTLSEAQKRVVLNAQTVTDGAVSGNCLGWVENVLERSNIGPITRLPSAGASYNAYCRTSDRAQLKPGMIVAVSTHSNSDPGVLYGHVGIYIGGGKVAHNIGGVKIMDFEEWCSYYGTTVTPKWGWHDNRDLSTMN